MTPFIVKNVSKKLIILRCGGGETVQSSPMKTCRWDFPSEDKAQPQRETLKNNPLVNVKKARASLSQLSSNTSSRCGSFPNAL